jgi:replicative DNA helicase
MSTDDGFNIEREERPRRRREPEFRVVADNGRQVPASSEAEEHVLACCLLDGSETIGRCLEDKLAAEAFYFPANRIIWNVMLELYRRCPPVTLEKLGEELVRLKQLDAVGGWPYLMQVTGKIPTTAHAGFFVERVKEVWLRRDMIRDASEAVEKLYAFEGTLAELENTLAPLAARLYRAAEFARGGEDTMQQRAAKAYERTKARLAGNLDTSRQLSTGLAEFDRRFGPFDVHEEEWLIGIAAPTSGGKSALVRNWADSFALQGKVGIIFLLETSVGKFLDAAAATAARVNARMLHCLPADKARLFSRERMRRQCWVDGKRPEDEELAREMEANGQLGQRWWIYDDPIRAETLCARVEEHVRQHGRPDYAVADHLQELYSSRDFKGFRSLEIGYIAKLLKRTAKRIDVPFFVPMQFNRGPAKEDRRPTKHDLRDSGEVENACDRLDLIHTPKVDLRGIEQTDNQPRVMVELIQAKSRNGPIGHGRFWFDRGLTLFSDMRAAEETPGAALAPRPSGGGFTKAQFRNQKP